MSETLAPSPAPVAAPVAAPARTAKTLAEAGRMAMESDPGPSVASGDAAPSAPALPADPMAQIAAVAALTEASARGENAPEPAVETQDAEPEAEPEPEAPKAEAAKPDFALVKHFRAKADSETQARMRAEAEVGLLRDQLQQVVEYLQRQQQPQAVQATQAEPEVEDDYGDPALQQLAAMRREMAEFKALKAELDAIKAERENEKLSAKASAIEADLRKEWDTAKSKYPVLGNREHAGRLWDMVKANPGLTVEDAAIILQHRFGESRPGPVPATQAKAPAQAAPPRPAPPRPPPGGAAAVVAPAAKIRTLEDAKRAAMAMR